MAHLVDLQPLEDYVCRSMQPGADHHRHCRQCDRGVIVPAERSVPTLTVKRRGSGKFHAHTCTAAGLSPAVATWTEISYNIDHNCGCLQPPDGVDVYRRQVEPLTQAVAGIIACASKLTAPTTHQLTRWRNALERTTHDDLRNLAAAARAVLDQITGDARPAPLSDAELRMLAVQCLNEELLAFGEATEWWPLQHLARARKTWSDTLKASSLRVVGGLEEAEYEHARSKARQMLGGSMIGMPGVTAAAMLDSWKAQIESQLDTTPERYVLVRARVGNLDLCLSRIVSALGASVHVNTDENRMDAVMAVPKVVRRYLMTTSAARSKIHDLGPVEATDGPQVTELAVRLIDSPGAGKAIAAARALAGC